MHEPNEIITLAWCDNGNVDGKFMQSILQCIYTGLGNGGVTIHNAARVAGNQIARQREQLLKLWYEEDKSDWLLWVDSDIVLTPEALKKIWFTADKNTHPIVTGVYFISKENELPLMMPMPCIFRETGDNEVIQYIHPVPYDQVIEVDCAGMGLVLMHRSVIQKMREVFPEDALFGEKPSKDPSKFEGEDIAFFRRAKKAGFKIHTHTGALVEHVKRFSFDVNFYNLYWKEKYFQEQANIQEQPVQQDK